MPKTNRSNITRRRPKSSATIGAAASPTAIELLGRRYVACRAEKRAAYASFRAPAALRTQGDYDRAQVVCDDVYNRLAGIWGDIEQARPVSFTDLSIKAQAIMQREMDLGGPCDEDEIQNFCREVQIAAGFASATKTGHVTLLRSKSAKRARWSATRSLFDNGGEAQLS